MSTETVHAQTVVSRLEPCGLIAVETWNASRAPVVAIDEPWRMIRVEPTVVWLRGPLDEADAVLARATETLGETGAATDLSGGFERIRISGPGWRAALMFGGVFDAEDPAFGPGATAGTLLHHLAVRYDVIDADTVEIYVAPSYAADLLHHLHDAARKSSV